MSAGDRDTTVRLLLALEDFTGMTFRELFGECEGRRMANNREDA